MSFTICRKYRTLRELVFRALIDADGNREVRYERAMGSPPV
jgi:hypothetical protein